MHFFRSFDHQQPGGVCLQHSVLELGLASDGSSGAGRAAGVGRARERKEERSSVIRNERALVCRLSCLRYLFYTAAV